MKGLILFSVGILLAAAGACDFIKSNKPEPKTKVKPETKPETKPEAKPDAKPELNT